jgi:hypothetical protein
MGQEVNPPRTIRPSHRRSSELPCTSEVREVGTAGWISLSWTRKAILEIYQFRRQQSCKSNSLDMFLAPDWLGSQVDSEARMIEFALSFVSRAKELVFWGFLPSVMGRKEGQIRLGQIKDGPTQIRIPSIPRGQDFTAHIVIKYGGSNFNSDSSMRTALYISLLLKRDTNLRPLRRCLPSARFSGGSWLWPL